VIARLWSERTTPAQATSYADHLSSHVLPKVKKLDGYAGAMLLEWRVSSSVEIIASLCGNHSIRYEDLLETTLRQLSWPMKQLLY
jgi:hypothetical protein